MSEERRYVVCLRYYMNKDQKLYVYQGRGGRTLRISYVTARSCKNVSVSVASCFGPVKVLTRLSSLRRSWSTCSTIFLSASTLAI